MQSKNRTLNLLMNTTYKIAMLTVSQLYIQNKLKPNYFYYAEAVTRLR